MESTEIGKLLEDDRSIEFNFGILIDAMQVVPKIVTHWNQKEVDFNQEA